MPMSHQIGSITVHLKISEADLARDIQHEVSTFCRTEVRKRLSDIFDDISKDRLIRLERLEIVLSPFKDVEAFRRNFVGDLSSVILENLREALDHPSSEVTRMEAEAPQKAVFDTEWKSADLFLNAVAHGSAPWTAGEGAFERAVKEVPELLSRSSTFRRTFRDILKGSGAAVKRLAMQFATDDICKIIGATSGLEGSRVIEVQHVLENILKKFESVDQVRYSTHMVLIRAALSENPTEESFVSASFLAFFQRVFSTIVDAPHRDRFLCEAEEIGSQLPDPMRDLFVEILTAVRPKRQTDFEAEKYETPGMDTVENLDVDGITASGLKGGEDGVFIDKGGASFHPGLNVDSFEQDDYQKTIALETSKTAAPLPEPSPKKDEPPAWPTSTDIDAEDPREHPYPETVTSFVESRGKGHDDSHRHKDTRPGSFDGYETVDPFKIDEIRDGAHFSGGKKSNIPSGSGVSDVRVEEKNMGADFRLEREAGQRRSEPLGKYPPWFTPHMDSFHIHNAGLVLTAPFFRSVFKDLNYLNGKNRFKDDHMQVRAVHFTQFLITGEKFPPETDLVLNKLLCGIGPETPVERFIELNREEVEVATDLLVSAIDHWKTLKKTSVPVFRQTFLRHFGILEKLGGNLRLRIERTAIDVLIDTLPWTISVIKHPWMSRPLMVEW